MFFYDIGLYQYLAGLIKCLLYSNILLSFYYLAHILSSSHYGLVNVNIGENTEAPCSVSISDISLYCSLILVDVI